LLTQSLLVPGGSNASDVALGYIFAAGALQATKCATENKEIASYIGTAATVRDLFSVLDRIPGDGMLRYWGISYGTTLGATALSMLPNRVEKVILDGVQNAHEYYRNEVQPYTDTDATFRDFCKGCVQHRDSCPIAANFTAEELEADIYAKLDLIKFDPIPLPLNPAGTSILLTASTIRGTIFTSTYCPAQWPPLAANLNFLFTGNLTTITSQVASSFGASSDLLIGIKCGDNQMPHSTVKFILPFWTAAGVKGRLVGDLAAGAAALCAQWPKPAVERDSSNFTVKPRQPVLLIGNSFDLVAPLAAAKNMSAGFDGSVVMRHDGYGVSRSCLSP